MFRIVSCETMIVELMNHKQTGDYSKNDITYFAITATIPENFDTIVCYIEQDKQNAVFYTNKLFISLAKKHSVAFQDANIFTNMTIAIVDILNHHMIDVSTFVDIESENDVADALLLMSEPRIYEPPLQSEKSCEKVDDNVTEKVPKKQSDKQTDIRSELITHQLNKKNKLVKKQYIKRALEIYDEIEDCLLKCRPNKKIHKLFGKEFTKKKDMDAIISAIKQIVTHCDDDSEQEKEQEIPATISEQVSNHITGFTLERNIVAPISDISYAVKQHFVISSINNINTIESYTAGIDNAFVQGYVNQTLRNMRNSCIKHIG